jgi:hypothetical protein
MTRPTCAIWTILLAACGAGAAGPAAQDPADAAPAGCPATWQKAVEATCAWQGPVSDQCAYGEATCGCSPHPQCGGATPEPPEPGDPGTYRCRSVDPERPLLREDGCPLNMPLVGDPCGAGGNACTYTGCPWESWEATCTEGAWAIEDTSSGELPM